MSPISPRLGEIGVSRFMLRKEATDDLSFDPGQLMANCSGLLEKMNAICDAINSEARQTLVSEETPLQQDQIACRYRFAKAGECKEYWITLAVLPKGPTLIFSSFRWDQWSEPICRIFGYDLARREERIYCAFRINPTSVSAADVEQWFAYLLSGLQGSFKPAGRVSLRILVINPEG